jgi:hypothetical protein
METQLYVRIRGRILGPFDEGKLRELAKRGQLSRLHDVSKDAMVWVRASEYPNLFLFLDGTDQGKTTLDSSKAASRIELATSQNTSQAMAASMAARRWWYRKNGAEAGPVDTITVQQMLASGNLGLDDVVWTEGMAQWAPVKHTPGLLADVSPARAVSSAQLAGQPGVNDELPLVLRKAAMSSYSWVLFVAVVTYIFAGLTFVGSILLLILGANQRMPAVVAQGLFGLIWGVDYTIGGFLMSTYASRVKSLRYSYHPMILEKAMDILRGLWIYFSVNLIVLLAIVVFVVVWVISIGGTLPQF